MVDNPGTVSGDPEGDCLVIVITYLHPSTYRYLINDFGNHYYVLIFDVLPHILSG